jgi:hypothetical protein
VPLMYRQRETDPTTYTTREVLHVEADGVYAMVHRDTRGTWRGRVLVMWGTVWQGTREPAHADHVAFTAPKAVGEGQIIAYAERTIRAELAALAQNARFRWWRALPPNCPAVPASAIDA